MEKRVARNIWLTNQYAKRYVKASGVLKEKLASKLEELQEQQSKMLKKISK